MTDLKYLSRSTKSISAKARKREVRWWWFNFNLRTRRQGIVGAFQALVVIATACAFMVILFYAATAGMGAGL